MTVASTADEYLLLVKQRTPGFQSVFSEIASNSRLLVQLVGEHHLILARLARHSDARRLADYRRRRVDLGPKNDVVGNCGSDGLREDELGSDECTETLPDSEASGFFEFAPTPAPLHHIRRHGIPTPPSSDSEIFDRLYGSGEIHIRYLVADPTTYDKDLYR